jgi:hypothetical protein
MFLPLRGSRQVIGTLAPTFVALVGLVVLWPEPVRTAQAVLPAAVERYLSTVVKPSASDRRRLLEGQPVTKLLETSSNEQVSVFGAIWVDAPMQRYVEAVRDIETFEEGGSFHVTRRIGTEPRLDDFDDLHFDDKAVRDLAACQVGDCDVKLDAKGIDAFRTGIDWASPRRHEAADALMRRLLLGYAQAYLVRGNSGLPVFHDKSTPQSMADEFRVMVDDMPMLTSYLPDVRHYLLDYPRAWLPGATSFLYWQETSFGLKPTIRVTHLTIQEKPDSVVVASKMIYAHHYFRSALELRLLLPDRARGRGFWFVTVVTSRTDGLTGFTGMFVRFRLRGEAREGTENVVVGTKRKLEGTD